MGRNKLKSFGPLMCRMAMLFHIRSGSFFFKALGITLLFMAGFPDDLVQRETKYRNLDLLQKYYRYGVPHKWLIRIAFVAFCMDFSGYPQTLDSFILYIRSSSLNIQPYIACTGRTRMLKVKSCFFRIQ